MCLVNFFKTGNNILHNNYSFIDSLFQSTGSAGRGVIKGCRGLSSDGPVSLGPCYICPSVPGGELAFLVTVPSGCDRETCPFPLFSPSELRGKGLETAALQQSVHSGG